MSSRMVDFEGSLVYPWRMPWEPPVTRLARPWLSAVPKVELHVHLEGSIPLPTLWQLVMKYHGEDECPTQAHLTDRFRYRNFSHFIDTWVWKNRFIRELEDMETIAEAAARAWVAEGIVYVEAFYSPGDFARHGLSTQEITCALRRGLSRVPEVEVSLIADLIRDFGPVRALRTLSEVCEVKDQGVIGIGIGGSEAEFPPQPFAYVFERARRSGFHTSAHAGEDAGAESIWGALESLGVERIGHATRAVDDPGLVEHLRASRTALELCPLSNCATGVIPELSRHPIRRYFDLGLCVSVNTDDPAMFGNSLSRELDAVADAFNFDESELKKMICGAAEGAWLSEADRVQLRTRLESDPAWTSSHGAPSRVGSLD